MDGALEQQEEAKNICAMEGGNSSKGAMEGGHRCRRPNVDDDDQIEEGEICYDCHVSGSETDDDEHHRRAVLPPRDNGDGCAEHKRCRLDNAATAPAPSAGPVLTTSNGSAIVAIASAAAAAAAAASTMAREVFACRICRKEFDTRKAVDGHMRVHRQQSIATPKYNAADNSRVTVVAEPRTDLDLSGPHGSSSAPPSPPAPANPPNHNQAVGHQPAAAAPNAGVVVVVEGAPQKSLPYMCKMQGCGRAFPTHQGLGGHAAGHQNRSKAAAAAASEQGSSGAGADGCHGGADSSKHRCRECGMEWKTGFALGGHMRKHQTKETVTVNEKEPNVAGKHISLGPPPLPDLTPAAAEVTSSEPLDQPPLLSMVVGAEVAAPALLALANEAAALPPQDDQAEEEAAAEAAAPAEAAALRPVEAGAEAADVGAAPEEPLLAPIAGMGTVRIFGFLVEKPAPGDGSGGEGSAPA